ncbi:Glutamyl-tRNA synthetase [Candidatus Syntrophocurvum alkaliphilum]|uniref:Glutamate--tRNA ligase n=1 Tax=Candidatus Syntrophocurvum alkaliphilum TaxID=2293317 RepID=A0A6I6DI70_9FIRM|nr:glutamate--tRNA ligase [Candidatus Syntrophocurvum alkaliphilum]QGU00753.1 Glutamyl-tRNA synthetase [Candidatus Syntrophocurvum alkaliphilum]
MFEYRVRFAPSPTGPLHIGGARSALFNYLFARNLNGKLIIRIEDTDLERSKKEYEDEIIQSLKWLGLSWDEGIDVGGDYGPYRQTDRLEIYKQYTEKLISDGKAYPCFCTQEELEQERQSMLESGHVKYSRKCLNLTPQEREEKIKQGIKPSIRLRVPENRVFAVEDLVRGEVTFDSNEIGDFIIVKSDGIPTYNFAVVIDDMLMKITHIIRAEEHLSNTPRQLMVYDALGAKSPAFAHISLILGEDKQKMSKRHGATSLIQYREEGYLPEALFNFLALLGWSPLGEEEILTQDEIISGFNLNRVSKSPAIFNMEKLNWLNQQYIKSKSNEELLPLLKPYLENSKYQESVNKLDNNSITLLIDALKDYLVCLSDITTHAGIVFDDIDYTDDALEVLNGDDVKLVLQAFKENYSEPSTVDEVAKYLKSIVKQTKLKPKNVFMPIRCALTGKTKGPDLPYLILIWGTEETLRRIDNTLMKI